jgi:hypothetical protein
MNIPDIVEYLKATLPGVSEYYDDAVMAGIHALEGATIRADASLDNVERLLAEADQHNKKPKGYPAAYSRAARALGILWLRNHAAKIPEGRLSFAYRDGAEALEVGYGWNPGYAALITSEATWRNGNRFLLQVADALRKPRFWNHTLSSQYRYEVDGTPPREDYSEISLEKESISHYGYWRLAWLGKYSIPHFVVVPPGMYPPDTTTLIRARASTRGGILTAYLDIAMKENEND